MMRKVCCIITPFGTLLFEQLKVTCETGTVACGGEIENGSIAQKSQDNETGEDGPKVSGAPTAVEKDENDNGYTSEQNAAQALTLSGYLAKLGILSNKVTEEDAGMHHLPFFICSELTHTVNSSEDENEHDSESLFVSPSSRNYSWKGIFTLSSHICYTIYVRKSPN